MKKILSLSITLIIVMALVGCGQADCVIKSTQNEITRVKFVFSGIDIDLYVDDSNFIGALLNGEWSEGTADCINNIIFNTPDGNKISYHSECGRFNNGRNTF